MTMRNDFCAFILTHGRANNVKTYDLLRKRGYTGKIYIVIDDEDSMEYEYRRIYGDQVLQFSKEELSKQFDEGDNFDDRRTITYARNACWELARQVGCRFFLELDDDYLDFFYRHGMDGKYGNWFIKNLDGIFLSLIKILESTPISSIAFSQGGDHLGGKIGGDAYSLKRKCMNTFFCDITKHFTFVGRFNEDVNTYTTLGNKGSLFFTVSSIMIAQIQTQSNPGGITELYKKFGTYVKSFTTVMYMPSCTKVKMMASKNPRLHHAIAWNNAVPKILRESVKR